MLAGLSVKLAATRAVPLGDVEIRPSPNAWNWPDVYEVENAAQDVTGAVWAKLRGLQDWQGLDVVDIGCGAGFHLPVFAKRARSVLGVEPYRPLVRRARRRLARSRCGDSVRVVRAAAHRLPLQAGSVDLLHARTAYFFGPGCEAGLAEARRVLRSGGALVIIDLDGRSAPYGDWMRADLTGFDPERIERFFASRGFDSFDVETRWEFDDRNSLEAVLRIEFSPPVARRAVESIPGTALPVNYRIRIRREE
ncbi:Methyltransferase domain-containing protein [Actinopolyspora lacussalsi subsp. righensis]|uniref:Methyltransferase domain-containing protein n=1 Tax=Actinopolyspora righensis TaxID=995060 RepID=A0A1I7C8I1_9ACTN|nr:class I SAM-dependent methyltransferase [Actinopolyspora righensis]SFT95727.1 Methyltransferase domain-containing protein [Actinopolyspora righensis]